MNNWKNNILDFYYDNAIFVDVFIITSACFLSFYSPLFILVINKKESQIDLLSNLIGTNVSLAGFMLAALTIIVTFKANINVKRIEDSKHALELILSTSHYKKIVNVFRTAILELSILFLLLLSIWVFADEISVSTLFTINCSAIFTTSIAILRSLYILFKILSLENSKAKE